MDRTLTLIIDLDDTPDPVARLFGSRIRDLRRARFLTQADVAKTTGMTPAYVSLVERGKANPTLDIMVKLGDAVGAKVWDLVKPDDDASK